MIRLVVYVLALVVLLASITLIFETDAGGARFNDQLFTERAAIEWLEAGLLLLCAVIAALAWSRGRHQLVSLWLGALAAMAMVREMDFWLDHLVFDGAWQILVTAVLAGLFWLTWRNRQQIRRAAQVFWQDAGCNIWLIGVIIVVVFSRLYGQGELWQQIMGDGYQRSVKNFAEEAVELLGMSVMLIGSLRWLIAVWSPGHASHSVASN